MIAKCAIFIALVAAALAVSSPTKIDCGTQTDLTISVAKTVTLLDFTGCTVAKKKFVVSVAARTKADDGILEIRIKNGKFTDGASVNVAATSVKVVAEAILMKIEDTTVEDTPMFGCITATLAVAIKDVEIQVLGTTTAVTKVAQFASVIAVTGQVTKAVISVSGTTAVSGLKAHGAVAAYFFSIVSPLVTTASVTIGGDANIDVYAFDSVTALVAAVGAFDKDAVTLNGVTITCGGTANIDVKRASTKTTLKKAVACGIAVLRSLTSTTAVTYALTGVTLVAQEDAVVSVAGAEQAAALGIIVDGQVTLTTGSAIGLTTVKVTLKGAAKVETTSLVTGISAAAGIAVQNTATGTTDLPITLSGVAIVLEGSAKALASMDKGGALTAGGMAVIGVKTAYTIGATDVEFTLRGAVTTATVTTTHATQGAGTLLSAAAIGLTCLATGTGGACTVTLTSDVAIDAGVTGTVVTAVQAAAPATNSCGALVGVRSCTGAGVGGLTVVASTKVNRCATVVTSTLAAYSNGVLAPSPAGFTPTKTCRKPATPAPVTTAPPAVTASQTPASGSVALSKSTASIATAIISGVAAVFFVGTL